MDDSLILRLAPSTSYDLRDLRSPISDEKLHEEKSPSIGVLVGVINDFTGGVTALITYPESEENAREAGGTPELVEDSEISARGVSPNSSSSELLDESM